MMETKDKEQEKLEELTRLGRSKIYINFSRNFGHQPAVKAGFGFCDRRCNYFYGCRFTTPIKLILNLSNQWEDGYDIVYTIREYRKEKVLLQKTSSSSFYKILNKISDINIEKEIPDYFELMNQSMIEVIRNWNEDNLFLRGIIKLGKLQTNRCSLYSRRKVFRRKANATFEKMIKFAVTGCCFILV